MTAWLLAATWKGTLLVLFALAVRRFARNHVPSRWLCALLLVALTRLLIPAAPSASFSVFNLVPYDTPAPVALVSAGKAASSPPARVRIAEPGRPATNPLSSPLLLVWAAGVAFVVVRTTRRIILFHRQLADRRDVVRDDVRLLLDECRARLGIRRSVRIATTGAVVTPSLHGWLRPCLLLPPQFLDSFTLEQVRYVFLHELAHLRRSDVLINWIAITARAVHWFNPLVHLAVARLAEERELACDAIALEALRAEERPAYGGTVLEIVDRMRTATLVPALVGMTATPQQLKRRIMMIASFRRQPRHSIFFTALVAAIALLTLTDARAGEVQMKMRHSEPLSPATAAVVQKLETRFTKQLEAASLDEVLNAISNATGASITVPADVIDDATRQKRLTVKAVNIPSHLVLLESLHSLGLGAKFTDTGVEVIKHDPMEAARTQVRLAEGSEISEERVMVLRDGSKATVAPDGDRVFVKKMEVEEGAGNKRTLRFRGHDGDSGGTLEIEVK